MEEETEKKNEKGRFKELMNVERVKKHIEQEKAKTADTLMADMKTIESKIRLEKTKAVGGGSEKLNQGRIQRI